MMVSQKKIGLIGTGSMGTAIGKLLLQKGFSVTVWNRTISKTSSLENEGAICAKDVASLLQQSDTIIICVSNYSVSDEIFGNNLISDRLTGKTIIQLSTGTPKDATDYAAKFRSVNANYLDGAIMVTPSQIGTSEAMILVSGEEGIYRSHEEMFKTLATNTIYVGEGATLASAWDLAFLSYFFGSLIGFINAAKIAKAEGVDIAKLGLTAQSWSPAVGSIIKEAADIIASGDFTSTESTVKTCFHSVELILRHARQANISTTFSQFAFNTFESAMKKGLSSEDGVAIFKTL